tara:strand:- start:406 stop:735 length:330 start_codon:yes stop_codon:yes gene_type:complete
MTNINEEKLAPIEINLNPETIDEGYLAALGGQLQLLLKMMFGGSLLPTAVRGTERQVSAFARALGNEKKYLQSFEKHGLSDKRTLGNRHQLEKAVAGFEKETGIKWPFK